MGSAVNFTERLFWTLVWIAVLLVILYAVLGFVQNRFGGNFLGTIASWFNNHLQPQG